MNKLLFARNLLTLISLWMPLRLSLLEEASCDPAVGDIEEYCLHESFQPRCLKNEVILMKTATYGRMRIGRCITPRGSDARGPLVVQDPRYLGCSVDILNILDHKCSGKTECEIRVVDMALENVTPSCYSDLMVYLEVSYECISVADEERSCSVSASLIPTHVISSSESQRLCGTKSQPWIVDAPNGQKVNIRLIDFNVSQSLQVREQNKQPCYRYGIIVDKTSKQNVTICGNRAQREKELYTTTGSTVDLIFNTIDPTTESDERRRFLIKITAVGCSDLIPPEDAWLKRNDDSIVIGCYSSRQTWHLHCEGEKWIGVFGNCSQAPDAVSVANVRGERWSDAQVLAMVAVGGFTLTICLVVLCIGLICFRRFSVHGQKNQDYKTLNLYPNSSRNQLLDRHPQNSSGITTELSVNGRSEAATQSLPTYSIYVGQSEPE